MGGKLFHLPRMPRAEYVVREAAVRAALDGLGITYRIPRFYGDKVDFGDMDVIVPMPPDWQAQRQAIVEALGIVETKSVGRLFSTVFRGLQTDFFAVPPQYLESTYNFMSFNDLGNLIGRMCRRFELKWGEQGLSYVFRRSSAENYVVDIPVTQDFARVCTFLGLDHTVWESGFATLVELYEWVITSPYFSVVPYLDEVKHTRERPTIARFREFLDERKIAARPEFADRKSYLPQVAAAFPEAHLLERLAAERAAETRAVEITVKWNGDLVMRLRPERDQALGALMKAFKRSIAPTDIEFDAWVLATPAFDIEQRIVEFGFEDRRDTY
jgi:hypothetical protein